MIATIPVFYEGMPAIRIDWFTVIVELEREHVSIAEQAKHCSVARGTVSYWKAGGEPKHSDGQHLLGLYVATFGKQPPICK